MRPTSRRRLAGPALSERAVSALVPGPGRAPARYLGSMDSRARKMTWTRGRVAAVSLALALAPAASPADLAAQLPTLAGSGLEYISPGGLFQVTLSGQLDLEAIHTGAAWAGLVTRTGGESPLPDNLQSCAACHVGMGEPADGGAHSSHRLRVLADIFLGDHVYSRVEVRNDRASLPGDEPIETRVEQAFLRLTSGGGNVAVQVGRFASPFGSYPLRHLTEADPFLRPPIGYDYRTIMNRTMMPRAEGVRWLRWKHDPHLFRRQGTPPVWDVPYQWGAMALGRVASVDVRVAAMNSAPSSGRASWAWDADRLEDPSWVVSARRALGAEWTVGASYNRGPWKEMPVAGTILPPPGAPAGAEAPSHRSFDQELVSVDVAYERGPINVRAETIRDRWEVANFVEVPEEMIYSIEMQLDLAPGFFVGARVGHIDFQPFPDGLGDASPLPDGREDWDYDVTRYEGSLGYRIGRNVGLLLSAYAQDQEVETDGDTSFAGLRLWWAF